MGDEEKIESQEQVSEVVEEKPDIHPSGLSKNKPSDSILNKIADLFKPKEVKEETEVESTEQTSEPEGEEDVTEVADSEDSDEYEEIDPVLVDAGRRFGLSDEQIIRYAENDPLYLRQIRDYMDESKERVKSKPTDGTDKEAKDSPKALKVEDLVKSLSEDEDEQKKFGTVLTPFVDEINALRSEFDQIRGNLKKSEKVLQERELVNKITTANQMFDKYSEDFPELGKTGDLPQDESGKYLESHPAVVARSEIWDVAVAFEKTGKPFSVALANAFQWYAGKNAEANAEKKLVKKLSKRQEKLTPKKQAKATVKKFASEDDRKADVIKEAKRKAGVPVVD